jgi:hypothetical protein
LAEPPPKQYFEANAILSDQQMVGIVACEFAISLASVVFSPGRQR